MNTAIPTFFGELRQLAWIAARAMPLVLLVLAIGGWVRSRYRIDCVELFLHRNIGTHADMVYLRTISRGGVVHLRFETGQTPGGEASMAAVLPAYVYYTGPVGAGDPPRDFWERIGLRFRAKTTPIMADFIGTAGPARQLFITLPYWGITSFFAGIVLLQFAARRRRLRATLRTARHFPVTFLLRMRSLSHALNPSLSQ